MKILTGAESFDEIILIGKSNEKIYIPISAMVLILKSIIINKQNFDKIIEIADTLECENFEYDDNKSEIIARILFELSTPEVNYTITEQRICDFIAVLEAPSISL
jgi:hypothetical protein